MRYPFNLSTFARFATFTLLLVVAGCSLMFRVLGLGRSLWIDEAWLANSVTTESLTGMFQYEAWLQTSPPLFLLMVRTAVQLFGLSAPVVRLVPELLGLLSMAGMFLLARRVLSPRFSRLAWAIVALSPVAIEYAKTMKPFSAELAVAIALLLLCFDYLRDPTGRRFLVLLAAVAVAPFLAYSAVFLVPGIILVVTARRVEPATSASLLRGGLIALTACVVLAVAYLFFISPNAAPALSAFWRRNHGDRSIFFMAHLDASTVLRQLPLPTRLMAKPGLVIFGAGLLWLTGLALAIDRFRRGRRQWLWIQLICAVPCLLLIACSSLELYPINERVSLFLLPPLVLLLLSSAQLTMQFILARRGGRRRLTPLIDAALLALIIGVLWQSVARQPLSTIELPQEDAAGAVLFLASYAQDSDLVWVHSSAAQAFILYRKIDGWTGGNVRFGSTGWPCCPRGIPTGWGFGNEAEARADLDRTIPRTYEGKVWLLHTGRMDHWRFLGLDESRVAESVLTERGCVKQGTPTFHNMAVSLYSCRIGI